jgi:aromatic-ring opening dioxygenase LigAB LigA subunit
MSLYQLNKIMYLLEVDAGFLARMKSDAADAIKDMELTEDERAAVLSGDVGKLYLMGVNMFILDSIARHELFGIDRNSYLAQVRAAAAQARDPRPRK